MYIYIYIYCPVGETAKYTDCFSTERKTPPHGSSRYDTKQSDGEVPVMLELWGMQSTPSLPSFPGPL